MQPYPSLRTVTTLCAGFAASLLAFSATATDVEAAHVLELSINKNFGNYVFVKLDKAPAPLIACASAGNWHYTLALSSDVEKRLFALLVTAQTTGKQVSVGGAGACNEFGSVESMAGLRLYP